jgi:hypothetical protein
MKPFVRFVKDAPLVFLFLLTSLSYAVGFTLFGGTEAVGKSSLFKAMENVDTSIPHLWGAILLVALAFTLGGIYFRRSMVISLAAIAGFMLWLFATLIYALEHNWLTMISVSFTSMCFWAVAYAGGTINKSWVDYPRR